MRTFRFLSPARKELLDETKYYGSVRLGYGIKFEQAVSEAVRRAVEDPEHGAPRSKSTRRLIVQGFPFSIIYRTTDTEILVIAVADSRRTPEYWSSRVQ